MKKFSFLTIQYKPTQNLKIIAATIFEWNIPKAKPLKPFCQICL